MSKPAKSVMGKVNYDGQKMSPSRNSVISVRCTTKSKRRPKRTRL